MRRTRLIPVRDAELAEASAAAPPAVREARWTRRKPGEPRTTRALLLDEPAEVGDRVILRDPVSGFNTGAVGVVLRTFRRPNGTYGAVACLEGPIPTEFLALERAVGLPSGPRPIGNFLDFTQEGGASPIVQGASKTRNIFDFTAD